MKNLLGTQMHFKARNLKIIHGIKCTKKTQEENPIFKLLKGLFLSF